MAKGDSQASQSQINQQGGTAQNNLNNLWGQNTDRTTNFQNLYQPSVGQNLNDYNSIMSNYNNFLNPGSQFSQGQNIPGQNVPRSNGSSSGGAQAPNQLTGDPAKDAVLNLYNKYGITAGAPGSGLSDLSYWSGTAMGNANGDQNYVLGRLEQDLQGSGPDSRGSSGGNLSGNNYSNAIGSALGGYQDFADTGGFTPQNIADMRARAIAPAKAVYQNAQNNIDRQKSLQGGYSPNYTASSAKIARDESQAESDANVNADASLAQLVQQGRLYGNAGLAGTGGAARGQNLQAIGGQQGLYGSTPGLTNTFGNQVLQSGEQGVQLGNLQNQLANILISGQNQHAQIPGNFQSALGNLTGLFGLGSQIGGALSGLPIGGLFGNGGLYPTGGSGGSSQPGFSTGIG